MQSDFPPCFHLATLVHDLDAARAFYGNVLGCEEGRSTDCWVDFNFFGHQLSLHLGQVVDTSQTSRVEPHDVPMPHFGAVIPIDQFEALVTRLKAANTNFILEPQIRYPGDPGEQRTMFFRDQSGNAIEIKSFADPSMIFEV